MTEPFVLDLASNPHPRMLAEALRIRGDSADAFGADATARRMFWLGYLTAMCDATGCLADDIEAWMDSHEAKA